MKKILFIAISVVLGFTSCNLEREDYTEISPETFPQTENDLRLAVNALMYEFCTGYWNGEAIYSPDEGGYQVMSDMTTDALWSGTMTTSTTNSGLQP